MGDDSMLQGGASPSGASRRPADERRVHPYLRAGVADVPHDVLDAMDQICSANLLRTSNEIIYFKDLDSRFIRVSVGCAALHGRTPEQMVGLTDAELFDRVYADAGP